MGRGDAVRRALARAAARLARRLEGVASGLGAAASRLADERRERTPRELWLERVAQGGGADWERFRATRVGREAGAAADRERRPEDGGELAAPGARRVHERADSGVVAGPAAVVAGRRSERAAGLLRPSSARRSLDRGMAGDPAGGAPRLRPSRADAEARFAGPAAPAPGPAPHLRDARVAGPPANAAPVSHDARSPATRPPERRSVAGDPEALPAAEAGPTWPSRTGATDPGPPGAEPASAPGGPGGPAPGPGREPWDGEASAGAATRFPDPVRGGGEAEEAHELARQLRERLRRERLAREQRGDAWSESRS